MFPAIAPFLFFSAFLLLLLVSLSLPIIKSIYLFQITANITEGVSIISANANGSARFGVWGYCISAIRLSAVGQSINEAAQCSRVHLGYTFDSTLSNALHISNLENVISRATTAALVLHPIACGLTFLALLFSLALLCRPSAGTRLSSGLTLATGLLASLITTIVFLIDVIFVAVLRSKVRNASDGDVSTNWGNAVWMTLGATIALWAACVGACFGICACGGNRRRKHQAY